MVEKIAPAQALATRASRSIVPISEGDRGYFRDPARVRMSGLITDRRRE